MFLYKTTEISAYTLALYCCGRNQMNTYVLPLGHYAYEVTLLTNLFSLTAIGMFLACVIYPSGWDAKVVADVCNSSSYDAGDCKIKWTYILAIIAIFDAIILSILAFVLAFKHTKLLPWQGKRKVG